MIEAVKKNTTEGVTAKFECDFSTTGRVQRILSTAIVMNTYKQYFAYGRCIPLCGIQNVHFGGTLEDWKSLCKKIENLSEYDVNGKLKKYIQHVKYILEKFVETYEGTVDLDWWNKILSIESTHGSGKVDNFSGWITHLFGYY